MKLHAKNKLLIFGIVMVLYCSYTFAISKTLFYYNLYSNNEKLLESNINKPNLLNRLGKKEQHIDRLLTASQSGPDSSFQNFLLKQLSYYARHYNLKIVAFNAPHGYISSGTSISSYVFSIEGSFNGCMAMLNKLENEYAIGNIKHVTFTKKKNYRTSTEYLVAEVIIQKISDNAATTVNIDKE
ncbi:MAG TPA: hypothetical protein VF581_05605 [Flavobacterium sp.]|jgi:hypothetical protein